MNHTPFIVAAYAVFFAVLLVDLLSPLLARRRLLANLRGRLRRAERKASR